MQAVEIFTAFTVNTNVNMIRCRTIGTLSCLFIVVIIFKTVLAETISDSEVHLEFNIEGEGFHQ